MDTERIGPDKLYFKDFASVMSFYRPYYWREELVSVAKDKIAKGFAIIGEPPKIRGEEWLLNCNGLWYHQPKGRKERCRFARRDTRPEVRERKIREGLIPAESIHV